MVNTLTSSSIYVASYGLLSFLLCITAKYLISESTVQLLCSETANLLPNCYDELSTNIEQELLQLQYNEAATKEDVTKKVLDCINKFKTKNIGNNLLQSTHYHKQVLHEKSIM